MAAERFNAPPPSREQNEADWLRQDALRLAPKIRAGAASHAEDGAGAVDGIKNGEWGFHTEFEDNPWWQVDLGAVKQLNRLVVFNSNGPFAERAARLRVLVSDAGDEFRQVYEHDGSVFLGLADGGSVLAWSFSVPAPVGRVVLPGVGVLLGVTLILALGGSLLLLAERLAGVATGVASWARGALWSAVVLGTSALTLAVVRVFLLAPGAGAGWGPVLGLAAGVGVLWSSLAASGPSPSGGLARLTPTALPAAAWLAVPASIAVAVSPSRARAPTRRLDIPPGRRAKDLALKPKAKKGAYSYYGPDAVAKVRAALAK